MLDSSFECQILVPFILSENVFDILSVFFVSSTSLFSFTCVLIVSGLQLIITFIVDESVNDLFD